MEDYILREIDKIGKVIQVLLLKLRILKETDDEVAVCKQSKTELLDALNLDVDALLAEERFIDILVDEHGFKNENLEQFAELLFDFLVASEDPVDRVHIAARIGAIYSYLDEIKAPVALNRYYILKEIERYVE